MLFNLVIKETANINFIINNFKEKVWFEFKKTIFVKLFD